MSTRAQNEKKFGRWDELPGGGRRYQRRAGQAGLAGALPQGRVDSSETTVRFWQEIYDDTGKLVETHEKFLIARLGVADVRAFGLAWEDCEELLRKLGFSTRVEVVAA